MREDRGNIERMLMGKAVGADLLLRLCLHKLLGDKYGWPHQPKP
jgi:hypothetical protein